MVPRPLQKLGGDYPLVSIERYFENLDFFEIKGDRIKIAWLNHTLCEIKRAWLNQTLKRWIGLNGHGQIKPCVRLNEHGRIKPQKDG